MITWNGIVATASACAHRAEARRQPALEQARAELDPVGARLLRGDEAVDAFDADFDERLGHARSDGAALAQVPSRQAQLEIDVDTAARSVTNAPREERRWLIDDDRLFDAEPTGARHRAGALRRHQGPAAGLAARPHRSALVRRERDASPIRRSC